LDAINIYKEITKELKSKKIENDFAYALRSYSKFLSDYDLIEDAIKVLKRALDYIDVANFNLTRDVLMQLAMRYFEQGNCEEVNNVLKQVLDNYLSSIKRDEEKFYANIANVYVKLLRNLTPSIIKARKRRGIKIEYEEKCLEYLEKYKELLDTKKRKNGILLYDKLDKHDKEYAYALTGISLYYCEIGESEKAIEKLSEARDIHSTIKSVEKHNEANCTNNHFYLARALNLHTEQHSEKDLYDISIPEIEAALKYYEVECRDIQDIPSIKKGLADTNLALAETLDNMGEIEESKDRYKKAIELYLKLDENEQAKGKYKELLKKAKSLLCTLDDNK
jgi:tetratricopeptide (TPR) repeat protein